MTFANPLPILPPEYRGREKFDRTTERYTQLASPKGSTLDSWILLKNPLFYAVCREGGGIFIVSAMMCSTRVVHDQVTHFADRFGPHHCALLLRPPITTFRFTSWPATSPDWPPRRSCGVVATPAATSIAWHCRRRRFTDLVRDRLGHHPPMKNETLAKILCHNICCLISAIYELGVEPQLTV